MSALKLIAIRAIEFTESVLRESKCAESARSIKSAFSISSIVISIWVVAPVYGLAMGSYGFFTRERNFVEQLPQVFYSAAKVPLILLMVLCVSIPVFFVINRILGLRDDLDEAIKAIVSSLSAFSISLTAFAPMTLFFYCCLPADSTGYQIAVLFNAVIFGIAAVSSQFVLFRSYRILIRRNQIHRFALIVWIVVFAFVGIQVGWTMRPFIGNPSIEISFFRQEPFSNAYIRVIELFRSLFFGG